MTTVDLTDTEELRAIALAVAEEGGRLAARGYRAPKHVFKKGALDLVTEFDTAVEELIKQRLSRETPNIPIVAEEGGGEPGARATWYVDPIDGTTNYAHGHPFWCVSVGLHAGGTFLVGAVVAPALATTWSGAFGMQSTRNGEPCRVSEVDELEESLLATGFPYDRKTSAENNFATFAALKRISQGVRRCGSAALDLCLVADGTYDGYWERKLKPWDITAGACIVLGAGGRVTDFAGEPLDPRGGYVIASNGRLHGALAEAVRAAGP